MMCVDKNKQISFSWDLHYRCNFRCPYCWYYGKWHESTSADRHFSVSQWMRCWLNIYKNYGNAQIEILGGEPFIYPNFIELIKELSAVHNINITTNLSNDIEFFIKNADPSRVKLYLTFHPLFADVDSFIKKALILKECGFTEGASYLAYPLQVAQIPYYKERFSSNGLSFSVLPFWGKHKGVAYPDGYTDEEREIIGGDIASRVGQDFQVVPKIMKKNKLCRAGHRYAVIRSNGDVSRCGGSDTNERIGNFFDENFKLLPAPMICDSKYCKCNEWAFLLEDEEYKQENKTACPAPSFKTDPPYRVFWNWDMLYECNYKCSYCPIAHGKFPCKGGQEKRIDARLSDWEKAWDRIFNLYYSCVVRLSGGEPAIHPLFYDLVTMLTERHAVDITTNLSFNVNSFIENIKPSNVYISASFHPEFIDFKEFLDKAVFLKTEGYNFTNICIVSYPPFLDKIDRYKHIFNRAGFTLGISPFNGTYNGREYPKSHNNNEDHILRQIAESNRYEWSIKEAKEENGRLCRMGQMYAKILPNGDVTRCCEVTSGKLGNILDRDFKLLDNPEACVATAPCPCYKAMFYGEEKNWMNQWVFGEHKTYKTKGALNEKIV